MKLQKPQTCSIAPRVDMAPAARMTRTTTPRKPFSAQKAALSCGAALVRCWGRTPKNPKRPWEVAVVKLWLGIDPEEDPQRIDGRIETTNQIMICYDLLREHFWTTAHGKFTIVRL